MEELRVYALLLESGEPLGCWRISKILGWSPEKVANALKKLRRFGLVKRVPDPLRRSYVVWAPRVRLETVREVSEWIRGFREKAFVEVIVDSVFGKYFITGTYALCSLGECWNLAVPSGILVAIPPTEKSKTREVEEAISKRNMKASFIVKDFSKAEYFLDEESGIYFATKLQSYLDAFANKDKWGVDFFETLVSFAGKELVEFTEKPRLARKYRKLAQQQYPDKLQEALEPPYMLFKLAYEIFKAKELGKIAKTLKPPRKPRGNMKTYWEALRTTILGNTVSARLGYEPLVTP